MGIDGLGEREVGERSGGDNGYFVRVFVNHADQEVRGVFIGRFGGGRAFGHRRNFPGAVNGVAGGEIPGALINDLAVHGFPATDVFLGIDEREGGAWHDRNIGAADNFHQAQGVLDFFGEPSVAGDDGDAEDVSVG